MNGEMGKAGLGVAQAAGREQEHEDGRMHVLRRTCGFI